MVLSVKGAACADAPRLLVQADKGAHCGTAPAANRWRPTDMAVDLPLWQVSKGLYGVRFTGHNDKFKKLG